MDDLIEDFIAETRETLDAISGELVAWEADPGDRARLDAIFRFVHTVKGSCGFLDLPRLARLSHAAEDGLQAVRDGARAPDRGFVDAILAIVDRIGELTEAIAQGTPLDDSADDDLIAALSGKQAAPAAAPVAAERRAPSRSVRLGVELLDRMMGGMSDLMLVRNELARRIREIGADPATEAALERLSATVAELRDSVTRMRMQRVDALFAALPRMARDVSAELGKQVTLTIEGGDVELDREMIEMIRDPLSHILRNAIDHGIEPPAERVAAGKRASGRIRVSARQAGNQIEISVRDDGRGIDTEALVARAIAEGELTRQEAARLSEAARRELIFRAGMSTAREVSAISGRGVGMDVVRANVERIGGTVVLDSAAGRGLDVVLRVPLTLSIISAIWVGAGGQRFALPRTAIDEIVASHGGLAIAGRAGDADVVQLRGRTLPLVLLGRALGMGDLVAMPQAYAVVAATGGSYALGVDHVGDSEELVIKPAAPAVMATGAYAGETLPDSGRPMLVLDVTGLAARAGVTFERADPIQDEPDAVEATPTRSVLLFRALDGVRRALPMAVVDRVVTIEPGAVSMIGGAPHAVVEGAVLPLLGGSPPADTAFEIARIRDGERAIAYAITEAIDIVELTGELAPAAGALGIALYEGEALELVDPHALFTAAPPVVAGERTCALVADTEGWMETILAPLVEAAGYRVEIVQEAADAAGVAIALDMAAPVSLRRAVAPAGPDDASIYRYDRAALFAAIERAGAGR